MDSIHKNIITTPVSSISKNLFNEKKHALLGISPFNSYFSEVAINQWIQWAKLTFSSFHIFIPDTLPIYTFLALGYDENKAKNKAKRQAAYLKNKIFRALANHNIQSKEAESLIIDMAFLEKNAAYTNLKESCRDLYSKNLNFRKEADLSTGWVLNGQSIKDETIANQNIAVEYILAEIPLFIDTPSILNTSSSLFLYHQTPQIIKYLYTNHMQNEFVASNQGFMEVCFNDDLVHANGVLTTDGFNQ